MSRNVSRRPPQRQHGGSSNEEATTGTSVQTEMTWIAPLPPPQAMEHYNQVIPNGAERIMARLEKETEHRHAMEREDAAAVKRDQHIVMTDVVFSRITSFVFLVGSIGIAGYCAIQGKEAFASILGGGALVGVVWALRHSRMNNK